MCIRDRFADACKILSILVAIWVTNRGLTIVLIVLLPVLFLFTRYVQKNMLASQIANRRAVSRASGHVPETLHNIRTIHCLQKETYMEQQYARYIDDLSLIHIFLDSHDTERLMNRFHDLDKFYQQLAILFTLPGSPCIYYGTEIAMEGAHDPDCRRCMPWSEIESEENQKKIATMRKLIMLRRNEKVCRSLHFHFPNDYENDRCVEYIKLDLSLIHI